MDTKITSIKERILQIAEYKGFTNEKFCEKIGVSYSNFKGNRKFTSIGSEYLATILTVFSEISPDWLILGKGEMLRDINKTDDKQPGSCPFCIEKERIIEAQKSTISIQNKFIESILSQNKS